MTFLVHSCRGNQLAPRAFLPPNNSVFYPRDSLDLFRLGKREVVAGNGLAKGRMGLAKGFQRYKFSSLDGMAAAARRPSAVKAGKPAAFSAMEA